VNFNFIMDELLFSANLTEILREVKCNMFMGGGGQGRKICFKLLYIILTDRPVLFRVEK
jgi:hypothetical protein